MAVDGGEGSQRPSVTPYEEALAALSSLITKRSRADHSNKGDRFELLFDYIKVIFSFRYDFFFVFQIEVCDYKIANTAFS